MKIIIKTIFLFFFISIQANAINFYKYPTAELPHNFCKDLFNDINFPGFPYNTQDEEPIIANIDFQIEDIVKIDGKSSSFEATFSLWINWKDGRIIELLKEKNVFTEKGKPIALCDYDPDKIWGERKLFDPAIEFYSRRDKSGLRYGMSDWVDIFSDGTIEKRLRDSGTFAFNFDFKKFPFDNQRILIDLWPEFPANMISLKPTEPAMTEYAETLYFAGDEDNVVKVEGWNLEKIEYEIYEYVDNDGYPYSGFLLYLTIDRITSYYVFKIILPIIFILCISWSVFWVRGSQLEAKVNITIVCLLSLIAYNFIIDEDIPKLAYLTFLDSFILLSYFYTGIATILCVYSFVSKLKSGKDISIVDIKARWLGPLSYFGILLIMLIYFYNLESVAGYLLGSKFIQ